MPKACGLTAQSAPLASAGGGPYPDL